MRSPASLAALLASAALGAAPPLHAQKRVPATPVEVQSGHTAPAPHPKTPLPQKPLRVPVREVRVPIIVRDNHGHLATDLRRGDFQVYDDGKPELIDHLSLSSEPLSVVLVVENSYRVAALLPGIRHSGIVFADYVMGAKGKGAVLDFNDRSHLLVPFTKDADRIDKAISDLKPAGSGAHLYDALDRAVEMLQKQPAGRQRVIVVVAESVDTSNMEKRAGVLRDTKSVVTGSMGKLTSVLQDAELANISICSIGLSTTGSQLRRHPSQYTPKRISPPGTFSSPGAPGTPQTPSTMAEASGNMDLKALLIRMFMMGSHLGRPDDLAAASAATGGDHIKTSSGKAIQNAMSRIGSELHVEYVLSYRAPRDGPWGYHKIMVKVDRRGYRVLTRPGYLLAPG